MDTTMRMDTRVLSLLIALVLLMIVRSTTAQYWESPAPRFSIWEVNKATGAKEDLYTFLERGIPTESNCSTYWGTFFFRVTGGGKIDSLYHQGNLKSEVVTKINENIHSTEGHWKIPKGTKVAERFWFVFSYFDFGPYLYNNPSSNVRNLKRQYKKI